MRRRTAFASSVVAISCSHEIVKSDRPYHDPREVYVPGGGGWDDPVMQAKERRETHDQPAAYVEYLEPLIDPPAYDWEAACRSGRATCNPPRPEYAPPRPRPLQAQEVQIQAIAVETEESSRVRVFVPKEFDRTWTITIDDEPCAVIASTATRADCIVELPTWRMKNRHVRVAPSSAAVAKRDDEIAHWSDVPPSGSLPTKYIDASSDENGITHVRLARFREWPISESWTVEIYVDGKVQPCRIASVDRTTITCKTTVDRSRLPKASYTIRRP